MNANGQIMMTYRCSAACRHCLVLSSPRQRRTLVSVADAVEYARDFCALGRDVILAGGETLLFYRHTLAVCRALAAAGVPVAFIESNGSWCISDALVRERLTELRAAGVQGMYFSIDLYHQEFVAAERVCRGIRLARELFATVYAPGVSLAEATLREGQAADPVVLQQAVRRGGVHFIGRAALALAPLAEARALSEVACQDCRKDLDIDHLQEIQVDPYGFVRPDWCPGVNLGNARQTRVAQLCRTQHVLETPWLRELAEGGPGVLLPLARRYGIEPRATYASKCHLCFDLRRQLVHHLPAQFGPGNLYAERG
jgi:hypothetical protein